MFRLIVNADDLGLHPHIDEGIFAAHRSGVVTSASLVVAGRHAAAAAARARQEGLPLGVHLALTTHLTPTAPATRVRWLAPGGRFRGAWAELAAAWLARLIPTDEVSVELRAQVDRAQELGVEIDHLDTHQHLHLLPGLTPLVEGLARDLGVPLRWPRERPSTRWLGHPASAAKAALLSALGGLAQPARARRIPSRGIFESGRLTEARLVRLLSRLRPGVWEVVCHPGLRPPVGDEDLNWRYGWEGELRALTSPRVREVVDRRGIELVSFRGV